MMIYPRAKNDHMACRCSFIMVIVGKVKDFCKKKGFCMNRIKTCEIGIFFIHFNIILTTGD